MQRITGERHWIMVLRPCGLKSLGKHLKILILSFIRNWDLPNSTIWEWDLRIYKLTTIPCEFTNPHASSCMLGDHWVRGSMNISVMKENNRHCDPVMVGVTAWPWTEVGVRVLSISTKPKGYGYKRRRNLFLATFPLKWKADAQIPISLKQQEGGISRVWGRETIESPKLTLFGENVYYKIWKNW